MPSGVALSWESLDTYDSVIVLRNDEYVALLAGSEESYTDSAAPLGYLEYWLIALGFGCRTASPRSRLERGVTEVCEPSAPVIDDTSVSLLVDEEFQVEGVEVRVAITNDTMFGILGSEVWRYTIEVTSPVGTTVTLMDMGFDLNVDVDTTFSDAGMRFDEGDGDGGVLVFQDEGGRMQAPWPGMLSTFVGESTVGPGGAWEERVDVRTTTGLSEAATLDAACVRIWGRSSCTPPSDIECSVDGDDLSVSWSNGAAYESIEVVANGATLAVLAGDATAYDQVRVPPGAYGFQVVGRLAGCEVRSIPCAVEVRLAEYCSDPSLEIAAGTVVVETIDVTTTESAGEVEVYASVIADVVSGWRISVESPEGTTIVLHDGKGGSEAIDAIYSDRGLENTSLRAAGLDLACGCRLEPWGPGRFADLRGEPAAGAWSLEIEANGSAGFLLGWCVRLYETCALAPPSEVSCARSGEGVALSWTNSASYDEVHVYRRTRLIASLPGASTTYTDSAPEGPLDYHVVGFDDALDCGSERARCRPGPVEACSDEAIEVEDDRTYAQTLALSQTFVIGDVEVLVDAGELTAVGGQVHEVSLESPSGTTVVLSRHRYDPVEFGAILFSEAGVGYEFPQREPGVPMRPIGPGRLADFAGELSSGFQDWTLRHHHVAVVNEWCVRVYPAAGPSFGEQFLRGDADGNGVFFAIVDALYVLTYGFLDGPAPPCLDAADMDDSGLISPLLDGLYLLTYGFLDGPAPPAPGLAQCGPDPTDDAVECETPPRCPED